MSDLTLKEIGLKIAMTKIAAYEKRIAELEAPLLPVSRGLSVWSGWDRGNTPWSEAKHKDRVCYAAFGETWSMEDAAALIGFIEQTWHPAAASEADHG